MQNYANINDIVGSIRMQLNIPTKNQDAYLMLQVMDAERQIDSVKTYRQSVPLNLAIINNQSLLPLDFFSLQDDRILVDGGYAFPLYTTNRYPQDANSSTNDVYYTYTVNQGYITFSSNVTASSCDIIYNAFNVDEDGVPLISTTHVSCIEDYVCGRWCMREEKDANKVMMYMQSYGKKADKIRGQENMPSQAAQDGMGFRNRSISLPVGRGYRMR